MAEEDGREFASEIMDLGDKIAALKVSQAVELGDYLENKYNIKPAAAGAVAIAPTTTTATDEPVEVQTELDVILESFGSDKIKVIKVVREITSLGLKEAKELVESSPKPVKEQINKDEAEKFKKQLEEVGAKVTLK